MRSLAQSFTLAAVVGSALVSTVIPAVADTVKITVLGVGDIYNFEGGKVRGGFARLNAVAKAERAANPNTLYVFDGDMFSPSLLSGLDKGKNTVELTNLVPFDLAVPGNHEFDFGQAEFLARLKEAKYPFAAINLTDAAGKPVPGVSTDVVIKDMAGVNVALVPVAEDETPEVSSPGDWKFGPTQSMAIDAAKKARGDGADIVIGVVQAAHNIDDALLKSHAFDVIVSGDDHDYRTWYDGVTAYVETSTEANFLDPVDLTVTVTPASGDAKRSVTWTPSFRFVDTATVTPDAETQAVVDKLKGELSTQLDVTVGTSQSELDSRRNIVRSQESAVGDLVADAMRAETGADIAITNGGGIRGDKVYPAGTVLTRRDILTELPFGNVTVMTELTGKAILDALENGFSQVENGAGRFPQVSGMVVTADLAKPVGSRVLAVTVGGQQLDPAKTYKLATNDFMLNGGDGYTAFETGTVMIGPKSGHLMASDVIDFIQKAGSVDAKIDGRITISK